MSSSAEAQQGVAHKPDQPCDRYGSAAHLLAVPQICDTAWTREPRLPGESRADFVARGISVPA